MTVEVIHGDSIEVMKRFIDEGRTFSSIVADPPYHLGKSGFMGRHWDAATYGIAFDPQTWRLALDVLEPGGIMACFGGSRTQHRMAVAIEDAGFAIFDTALWLHGQGFPKSKSQLKPAYEPIILARKPTKGRVRALNIDACRVGTDGGTRKHDAPKHASNGIYGHGLNGGGGAGREIDAGRWPANLLHDGSDEVLDLFAAFGERKGHTTQRVLTPCDKFAKTYGGGLPEQLGIKQGFNDTGSAARFFYAAKASKAERAGSTHPCVKPVSLVRWVVRLATPPGGSVLDFFAGSGTTGLACRHEGMDCVLVEREAEYIEQMRVRLGAELEAAD